MLYCVVKHCVVLCCVVLCCVVLCCAVLCCVVLCCVVLCCAVFTVLHVCCCAVVLCCALLRNNLDAKSYKECAEFDTYGKALHIYMQITKTKPNFVDV